MFIKENIKLAIAGLKSNKMRSLLTMLGIIIGISSVIAIVSIGDSIQSALDDTFSQFGVKNISIGIRPREDNYNVSLEESDLMTEDKIDEIRSAFKNKIGGISLSEEYMNGSVKSGYKYANVSITGVNDEYDKVNNVKIAKGRFISKADVKGKKKTAVVSDKLVEKMFKNNENPLGKEIKITLPETVESYYIVGVYKYEVSAMENMMSTPEKDVRTQLYTTISSVKENDKRKGYSYFEVMPKTGVQSKELSKNMNDYLKKMYKQNKKVYARAQSHESEAESMTSMLSIVSIAISVIAAISLLVGGIGVMNIMLVSVTERTREIGTRKALGAKNYHIQLQFITEAVIICAIGGTIGISLGIGCGAIASILLKAPLSISISTIIISFVFSMSIGVFFGLYPARKAAKLNPIEALRYE
ncbi:MAG TPA: ABC transporter permease [Clostridium sp.]|nr:ABC transporter permease [Clostridium sp.]